ncbi:MAG: MerR family transcriptional regulator [Gemmatimonadetes bacterium]|nr:MerR family transcriptional regulator [Gemmatimonadota bacterium]
MSERTGLTPHVLRVWERRYGVVEPARSAGGQRLYSDADIERLRLLNLATQAGRNIGQIASLPNDQLQDLIRADQQAPRHSAPTAAPEAEQLLTDALELVERLDGPGVEATLRRAITSLGVHRGLDLIVSPMLAEIGERWHAADLTPPTSTWPPPRCTACSPGCSPTSAPAPPSAPTCWWPRRAASLTNSAP